MDKYNNKLIKELSQKLYPHTTSETTLEHLQDKVAISFTDEEIQEILELDDLTLYKELAATFEILTDNKFYRALKNYFRDRTLIRTMEFYETEMLAIALREAHFTLDVNGNRLDSTNMTGDEIARAWWDFNTSAWWDFNMDEDTHQILYVEIDFHNKHADVAMLPIEFYVESWYYGQLSQYYDYEDFVEEYRQYNPEGLVSNEEVLNLYRISEHTVNYDVIDSRLRALFLEFDITEMD